MKFSGIFAICFVIVLGYSCKNDSSSKTYASSEMVKIFSITLAKDTIGVGNMTYKDVKYFDVNDRLVKQEFFDKTDKLKGTEYIDRTRKTRHSEYFDIDSNLLSYYDLVFDSDLVMLKSAFDGQTNQFLRAEQYIYDEKGNRKEKIILDAAGEVTRVYKFAYDDDNNEIGFSGFDENGEIFLLETYKITKRDSKNRWTEKWGYRENVPYTFATREITD